MLPLIHDRMEELLAPYGVRIDHYSLCVHKPEDDCHCRKPKPKLLLDAALALGVDLGRSYMVGDKASDLEAGRNAGCRGSVLVRTGYGRQTESGLRPGDAAFVGDTLADAAEWISSRGTAGS
jgi:histidinol-phosphate phosphatase family protein